MAGEPTLAEIELKRTDFGSDDEERRAHELLTEWPTTFVDLGLLNDEDWTAYRDVYERYMGPPGTDRTIVEIREVFDSVENYLALREFGTATFLETKRAKSDAARGDDGDARGDEPGETERFPEPF